MGEVDKLSSEIFSLLESKFLSSDSSPGTPVRPDVGRVRILCIDAGGDGGVLAALSLFRLETLLKKQSGNPAACIADFFDVAAGSGAGGLLAAMLFTRGQDGRPLFTADGALRFLVDNRKKLAFHRRLFRKSAADKFSAVFSGATLRETLKPVLISCFDLLTGAPFMFSRSDAVESDAFNFSMKDVCAATCADDSALGVRSVDGTTSIKAVGGGRAGTGNPSAAAITHVLNNKREFPFADGPEDLLVVSLGSSEGLDSSKNGKLSAGIARRIIGEGANDVVDQSVGMAFGPHCSTNYVRIQGNRLLLTGASVADQTPVLSVAEGVLSQIHIESVMFRGNKVSEHTNGEKIDWLSTELIEEEDRWRKSAVPTVVVKPAIVTPRTSSATTVTVTSTATSTSAC